MYQTGKEPYPVYFLLCHFQFYFQQMLLLEKQFILFANVQGYTETFAFNFRKSIFNFPIFLIFFYFPSKMKNNFSSFWSDLANKI
jgi:hypothetical protein